MITNVEISEDQSPLWMNNSETTEMNEALVAWELYCQEMPFDHLISPSQSK